MTEYPIDAEVFNSLPFEIVTLETVIPLLIGAKIIYAEPIDPPVNDGIDILFTGKDGRSYDLSICTPFAADDAENPLEITLVDVTKYLPAGCTGE